MGQIITSIFCLLLSLLMRGQANMGLYKVAAKPWVEQFGNHRTVIKVLSLADAVYAPIPWRLQDKNVGQKRLAIKYTG